MSETAFDEGWYLRTYPDVAAAVARGGWNSGLDHFDAVGRERGRFGSDTHRRAVQSALAPAPAAVVRDPAPLATLPPPDALVGDEEPPPVPLAGSGCDAWFYLAAYPLAAEEIAAGHARDAQDHHTRTGRARGYLTHRDAARAADPAVSRSRFGGFWTDHANAADVLAGRRALGFVDDRMAGLLARFIADGCVVLEGAVDPATLDAAAAAVDTAFAGDLRGAKLDGPHALDLHWLSPAIRAALFAPALLDLLHRIAERPLLLSRSDSARSGQASATHRDSAFLGHSLPMQVVSVRIALDDVTVAAGPMFTYPGTASLPEQLFPGEAKSMVEAARLHPAADLSAAADAAAATLARATGSMPRTLFTARRGDALVWAADLAHGNLAATADLRCRSVTGHYCPAELAPGFFETREGRLRVASGRNGAGGSFIATAHYDGPSADFNHTELV